MVSKYDIPCGADRSEDRLDTCAETVLGRDSSDLLLARTDVRSFKFLNESVVSNCALETNTLPLVAAGDVDRIASFGKQAERTSSDSKIATNAMFSNRLSRISFTALARMIPMDCSVITCCMKRTGAIILVN